MAYMRRYFAVALLSVVLVSSSPAKSKSKNMSVWMMPSDACGSGFHVEQEPNPFLSDVTESKEKGVVRFRSNSATLENYPDEITLLVQYRADAGFFRTAVPTNPPKACNPIDPNHVKFKAMWSNKSRTLAADGVVLRHKDLGPEPFCELTCSDLWVYELRIDSKDVPLTDNLVILIDSPEGKHLAKLVGGLGPLDHLVNPITD
jgi:hypothetical protein